MLSMEHIEKAVLFIGHTYIVELQYIHSTSALIRSNPKNLHSNLVIYGNLCKSGVSCNELQITSLHKL